MNIQSFIPLVNSQEIIDDLNLKGVTPKICHLYAIYPYNMNQVHVREDLGYRTFNALTPTPWLEDYNLNIIPSSSVVPTQRDCS